jgi:hypothetical protein
MNAPIEGALLRRAYMLGGNARVTLVGKSTRYTYKITAAKGREGVYWVSLLTGSDNETAYTFLGALSAEGFRRASASEIPCDAPSVRAFAWTWSHLDSDAVQIWHEGRCSKCGRPLTDPESIASGMGPYCAGRAK